MTLVTTATELTRLMRCIGSRLMPRSIPADFDLDARTEGNAAHWLAQQMFNGADISAGTKAFNGYVVTDEMIEHVQTYLSALDIGDMEIETTITGSSWEVRGRADHVKFRDGVLTIDDFKYGWRPVSPEMNWTMISHACGWSVRNNVRIDEVVLRIHQPRPYHPDGPLRKWSFTGDRLALFYRDIDTRLFNPTDELVSGPDHCAKCHAIHNCHAYDRSTWNAMDVIDQAFSDEMPSDVLAFEYETFEYAEKIIETRRKAVEELMTYRIKSGQVVPNYGLEPRYGQSRFIPGLTGKVLTATTGIDLTKDGTVTPAEAIRRGVPKHIISQLTDRPSIGLKLKRIDADAAARRVFGDRS